jgi:hypothetical protein
MTDVYEAILRNAVNIQWRPDPQQKGWMAVHCHHHLAHGEGRTRAGKPVLIVS